MADKILHKRSLTPGSIPTTSSLEIGELAINVNDGKLYLRQSGSITDQIINVGESASFAATASFVQTAQTASYVLNAISSSFATTAQNANTASFVQTAQTASYVLNAVSSSFATSSSFTVSSSRAVTSSFALTASYVANASSFPFTGSALITGSLGVTGSLSTRAQGALSTDIAFRVRNSADTSNLFTVRGDQGIEMIASTPSTNGGILITKTDTYNSPRIQLYDVFGQQVYIDGASKLIATNNLKCGNTGNGYIGLVTTTGQDRFLKFVNVFGQESLSIGGNNYDGIATMQIKGSLAYDSNLIRVSKIDDTNNFVVSDKANVALGGTTFGTSARYVLAQYTGTAPSTSITDGFQQYSADRNGTAGKASPHFRTEDGTVLWLGDESRLFNITASRTTLSASNATSNGPTLTVYGSGSTQPVFTVQGSQGELFSVTDSLTGSLFSVNDISGLPILEVFSDNTTLIGNYLAPSLNTTARNTLTASGAFIIYSLPTASYDGAWFEYVARSGSNARVGSIMAVWSGSSVNFTETTASQFGDTSGLAFTVIRTGGNFALTGSATTTAWTIKTIVRSI